MIPHTEGSLSREAPGRHARWRYAWRFMRGSSCERAPAGCRASAGCRATRVVWGSEPDGNADDAGPAADSNPAADSVHAAAQRWGIGGPRWRYACGWMGVLHH